MFSTEMEALLSPYNTSWSKDTVKQTRSELNPLGKGKKDSLTVHTNSWIKDQNGTILNLGSEQIFDTEKFEEMMKTMMKTMFNGFTKMAPERPTAPILYKSKSCKENGKLQRKLFAAICVGHLFAKSWCLRVAFLFLKLG